MVQDEDVELADADQRVGCLVGGGHGHRVLPLAFTVKLPGCDDHAWRHEDNGSRDGESIREDVDIKPCDAS